MNREELYLGLASLISRRSTCDRAHVGAVLVRGNRILSVGYNGSPPGSVHCDEAGCLVGVRGSNCIRTIHAEVNTVLHGPGSDAIRGSVLYSTHSPCLNCIKVLMSAGVKEVVFLKYYRDDDALAFLGENNQDGKIRFRNHFGLSVAASKEVDPGEFLQRLCASSDGTARMSDW